MAASLSLSQPPPPTTELQPVDSHERLVLLDAMRGFALCGIFIANIFVWFSGRSYLPQEQLEALFTNASGADMVALIAVIFFIFGKFVTFFSFLFGLGFAVQMGRAEQRGASIAPLYARRLGVLLLIGLAHLGLLWHGDILSTYALLGFGLLLFRNRSTKVLLIWAFLIAFVLPVIVSVLQRLVEADAAAAGQAAEPSEALKAQTLAAFSSGTYLEVLKANMAFYFDEFLMSLVVTLPALFGRFLLGLVAGRHRLFHHVSEHRSLFRKILVWGVVAGVVGNGSIVVVQQLFLREVLDPKTMPWVPLLMPMMRQAGELGLAAVYVASFTLLFQRSLWQRLLSVLAPAGQMALTHYLSQTVISVLIFYGFGLGLIGKLGPALCVALSLGIFALQVGVSHLWLARFRFGPAEWVWRSLTYGKAQPMRLAPAPTVAPAPV